MSASQACMYASERALPSCHCRLPQFCHDSYRECFPAPWSRRVATSSIFHPRAVHPVSMRLRRKLQSNSFFPLFGSCKGLFLCNASRPQYRSSCHVVIPDVGQVEKANDAEEVADSEEEVPGAKDVKVERVIDGDAKKKQQEVKESNKQQQVPQQKSQMVNRVIFGTGIGLGMGGSVLAGGWWFTALISAFVYLGTREYFQLVRSDGISDGMTPPPRPVSRACSVICAAMPLMTLYFGGRVSVAVTTAAFFLAIVLLFQREKPRFAQLSSAIFGLFYCGYLPCFWIKLRCGTAIPALSSSDMEALLSTKEKWQRICLVHNTIVA